ncbi:Uncharacterized metal-dependent hydrolase YcfH [Azospirillaceae bacterium]
MLIDSHCHLEFPDFAADLDQTLERARQSGVKGMATICTYITRFDQVRRLAEAHQDIACTVGVHPHHAEEEQNETSLERLVELASHPKVIGIGETGLDYFYEHSPRETQQKSFRTHIQACLETGLPLIVHTRDADEDTIRILQEEGQGTALRGVIHCFTSGRAVAEAALEMGFCLSISGVVTFRNAVALREILADVPIDRLLVETDAPYLAPVPKRGKRNEPAFVAHTAAAVAAIKGVGVADFAKRSTETFFQTFERAKMFWE